MDGSTLMLSTGSERGSCHNVSSVKRNCIIENKNVSGSAGASKSTMNHVSRNPTLPSFQLPIYASIAGSRTSAIIASPDSTS
jgi:hypothetical protein